MRLRPLPESIASISRCDECGNSEDVKVIDFRYRSEYICKFCRGDLMSLLTHDAKTASGG